METNDKNFRENSLRSSSADNRRPCVAVTCKLESEDKLNSRLKALAAAASTMVALLNLVLAEKLRLPDISKRLIVKVTVVVVVDVVVDVVEDLVVVLVVVVVVVVLMVVVEVVVEVAVVVDVVVDVAVVVDVVVVELVAVLVDVDVVVVVAVVVVVETLRTERIVTSVKERLCTFKFAPGTSTLKAWLTLLRKVCSCPTKVLSVIVVPWNT